MGKADGQFDVAVVGCGNAALCAALSARDGGAKVLVLEKAPEAWRGGNSAFSGGLFRFAFSSVQDIYDLVPDLSEEEKKTVEIDPYTSERFFDDLARVTEYQTDGDLAST
ncbi:MAG: FAD-binding protein, partial [Candidatus Tectomicrobia bacterium]|nr:FAD-binding protein [Candidatus Tectomicrobia bacterium]